MVEKILLPLSMEFYEKSIAIRDAAGWCIAFVYFSDGDAEGRFAIKHHSREQAEAFARWLVRTANAVREPHDAKADLARPHDATR
jgi:predicted secreted hydrolase